MRFGGVQRSLMGLTKACRVRRELAPENAARGRGRQTLDRVQLRCLSGRGQAAGVAARSLYRPAVLGQLSVPGLRVTNR